MLQMIGSSLLLVLYLISFYRVRGSCIMHSLQILYVYLVFVYSRNKLNSNEDFI